MPEPIDPSKIRRILLMQLAAIGDVILCTPAVRAARRAFPDARIDFLTRGVGVEALTGNPHLHELLAYPEGLRERSALLREIRRRRYDVVVDFHSNPRTAVVAGLSGARHRIGFRGRGPRNLAYSHLLPKERIPDTYSAWRKADMLALLGVPVPLDADLSLEIAVGEEERQWASEVWTRLGLEADRPVVAISAVSRERFKNWGPERWARVADALTEAGAQVLLTHGPGEREQAAAVAERMRHRPAWDHGRTTLRQLAALYERCAFWIGNDGGPKHVAVAAGLKTITIIRWTLGATWTDARPGSPHIFFEKAPPQGCELKCHLCEHLGCLEAITPEEVIPAALAALRASRADARRYRALPLLGSSRYRG